MKKRLPTRMLILERLSYDPETGVFTWLPKADGGPLQGMSTAKWNKRYAGTRAGKIDRLGRVVICLEGSLWYAHRLAVVYMLGDQDFDFEIDHANCDYGDNRWINLRFATRTQNIANMAKYKGSLPKGVEKAGPSYCARIKVNGQRHYLGTFPTPEAAHAAYREAAIAAHGEFARVV